VGPLSAPLEEPEEPDVDGSMVEELPVRSEPEREPCELEDPDEPDPEPEPEPEPEPDWASAGTVRREMRLAAISVVTLRERFMV
jgi:hypothetical protein